MNQLRIVIAAAAVVIGTGATARADVIVRGYVVQLEAGEMYFDIGRATGLQPGAPLRVKRAINLRHPVSGKMVSDELPLGTLTVAVVGDSLSMAVPTTDLLYPVAVGDVVEVLVARTEKAPEKKKKPKPKPNPETVVEEPLGPIAGTDAATARIVAIWKATSGMPIDGRIAAWEAYLAENPDSPYATQIKEELELLRTYREQYASDAMGRTASEPTIEGIQHASPTRWRHHVGVGLAFVAEAPGHISSAWIHYRKRGSDTYRKRDLERDGDGYLRAKLDADDAEAPGIEYFVEVVTDGGLVGSAVGTPELPIAVDIEAPRASMVFVEKRNRSRVTLSSSYLSFATFDEREGIPTKDFLWMFEADFFYRLRTRALYGMRMGMGVINGAGGYKDPAPGTMSVETAFNYGYTELELRASSNLAFLGRLVVGVGRDGLGAGGEGRVRLGPEDRTNLTFGVSSLQEIGFLSELKLYWTAFEHLPLGFAIALTNQPNPDGDLAVRFSTDIGLKAISWVQPTLRISYQGRTVEHSGLGAGLGVVFDW